MYLGTQVSPLHTGTISRDPPDPTQKRPINKNNTCHTLCIQIISNIQNYITYSINIKVPFQKTV